MGSSRIKHKYSTTRHRKRQSTSHRKRFYSTKSKHHTSCMAKYPFFIMTCFNALIRKRDIHPITIIFKIRCRNICNSNSCSLILQNSMIRILSISYGICIHSISRSLRIILTDCKKALIGSLVSPNQICTFYLLICICTGSLCQIIRYLCLRS